MTLGTLSVTNGNYFPVDSTPYRMHWNLNIQREIAANTVATIGYPNIAGWKMTYGFYEGYRIIAKGLWSLDRHVAILGALASRFL